MRAAEAPGPLGCHLPVARGYRQAAETARSIGADTFQFFARNPRGQRARAFDPDDAAALARIVEETPLGPLLAHAPYTMNLASPDPAVAGLGRTMLRGDLQRLARLPCSLYTLHPGSHRGDGVPAGIRRIAGALDGALAEVPGIRILLETMPGRGHEIGGTFEELARIMGESVVPDRLGVCLDTCHLLVAGYDLLHDPDGVLEAFDRILGLETLGAVHLNDSLAERGSRRDRHASLGQGVLGWDGILRIAEHPALRGIPLFLETPEDPEGHGREIAGLRERMGRA